MRTGHLPTGNLLREAGSVGSDSGTSGCEEVLLDLRTEDYLCTEDYLRTEDVLPEAVLPTAHVRTENHLCAEDHLRTEDLSAEAVPPCAYLPSEDLLPEAVLWCGRSSTRRGSSSCRSPAATC